MRKLAVLLLAVPLLAGCSAYKTAVTAYNVIEAAINIAKAEVPALPVPPQEQAAIGGYVSLAGNLNDQYHTCINNAQNTMLNKKGKFLDCLGVFAAGLNDPKELAQLRVLSPTAQHKVQLYATAFVVGINATIAALGGQAAPPPVIGAPVTAAELQEFRTKVLNGR